MRRGRGIHKTIYDRLARPQDMAKLWFNPYGNIWKAVGDFLAKVCLHRKPIDPAKPIVYTNEAQFLVEVTKTDRRVRE